jgi:hypothetical protein
MSGWLLSVIWLVLALVASFKGADPAYFMGFLILANLTRPAPVVNAGPLQVEYGLVWDDLGSADTFPTLDQARAMAASFQQQAQVVRIETWPVADEGAER